MKTPIVPCLLLPIGDKNFILPSAAIAEIIPFEKIPPIPDTPKWLLGILSWRGIHIPLAHADHMESHLAWQGTQEEIPLGNIQKYHIAVINRMQTMSNHDSEKSNPYPFFSVVLEGMPKLYRIAQDGIKGINKTFGENDRFVMQVNIKNEDAWIPNLSYLWNIIDALPKRLQWFRQIIL